jgi:VCBS repeat-containing protein
VAGTISFVAGETAKHGDMKVDTPVATMGIRGTAVLVEIDFDVPTQGGAPAAKFQVLLEPDGTTGSYVLLNKATLAPIATVNQSGTQTVINGQGSVNFLATAPLSADAQKIITDVFSLKFTDNSDPNPKTTTAQNDTITPQSGQLVKLASGDTVIPTLFVLNTSDKSSSSNSNSLIDTFLYHVPPEIVAVGSASIERLGITHSSEIDTASGTIRFADINADALPTVSANFGSFTFQNAQNNDVSASLTAQQLAAIAAVAVPLVVIPDPGNTNIGSASWTYSVPDGAFDFLAAGDMLTLIYVASVNDGRGGVVTTPLSVTITGTNDAPVITTQNLTGAVTGHASALSDSGTISFTDVDLSDVHLVSATGTPIGTALGTLTAVKNSDTTGTGTGGLLTWTYTVADSAVGYLAAGQTKVESFTITLDDQHGGLITKQIDVTITGTNDTPTIATTDGTLTELAGTGRPTTDHAGGTVTFTDADLIDRPVVTTAFTSFTYQDASHHDITSTLTMEQKADIAAVEASLTLTPTGTNANNGTMAWSYDVADHKFDFLAAGDRLTLTYTATVDDGHGGVVTQPFTVTITGTNDMPAIVGEINPPTQAVIVGSLTPVILDQGVNTNSIGLATETFDSLPSGASSNNGAGTGNFHSAILNATFSASGNAGVVSGSFDEVTGAPFVGPGNADTTNYLSIGADGTETITFATVENTFGFYWGSVDSYNTIKFYHGTTLVAGYTGADVSPLFADGNLGSFSSNGYVEFSGIGSFDKVVLATGDTNAFEIENISAGFVHAQLAAPVTGTLTVSDADVGDTLTASVSGNATIEYNGSTTLPTNADVNSLIAASAITFDSVTTDGGTQVLHWSYDPTSPVLDFLKAGDTLTITFTAQVDDGHGSLGNQPLTISLVGADKSANVSGFQVVSGTSQNDTFHSVGNGVNIFGGGGQDTFVFNAAFGSATISDFDVNDDTININHTLFDSVSAILASAQSINSGHDTIITDVAHDTITLKGVTIAQLQAHPGDFHLL